VAHGTLRQSRLAQPRLRLGAEQAVENARVEVAKLVNADEKEIIWTSGATESDNLAIKGAAHFYKTKGKHLITMKTEHKAVLDTMRELEREGFEVTYLDPEPDGLLDLEKFKAAIRPDTDRGVDHVGEQRDRRDPAHRRRSARSRARKDIIFHVDAAQATGKVENRPRDAQGRPDELLRAQDYGPKGIGALYVRRKPRVRLEAQMHGGGHEKGLRSGRSRRTRSSAWARRSASRASR
jgi:cysteine desulfurase